MTHSAAMVIQGEPARSALRLSQAGSSCQGTPLDPRHTPSAPGLFVKLRRYNVHAGVASTGLS